MIDLVSGSNQILVYSSILLGLIFITLLSMYSYKKFHHKKASNKLIKSMEKHGISVFKDKNVPTAEDDVEGIINKLKLLLEQEKEIKKEERVLSRKIEELYLKSSQILDDEDILVKQKKEDVDEDGDNSKHGKHDKRVNNNAKDKSYSGDLSDTDKKIILKVDDLLEKLPEDVVDDFVHSPDFDDYTKLVQRAKK
jgi:hypothetical protein